MLENDLEEICLQLIEALKKDGDEQIYALREAALKYREKTKPSLHIQRLSPLQVLSALSFLNDVERGVYVHTELSGLLPDVIEGMKSRLSI